MGNSHGSQTTSLHQEAALAARKFTAVEVRVLKEAFKDLAHRSPGKTMDKSTFLEFFPLPGLLGERLFTMFDRKNTGVIDYDEFMCGLAICSRGSWDDKVQLVFNLYDLAGDGTVSRAELTTMLNHVPRAALTMTGEKGSAVAGADTDVGGSNGHRRSGISSSGTSSADAGGDATNADGAHDASKIVAQFTNGSMVERAFAECDLNRDGRLSFEQFKNWCEREPAVISFLESALPLANAPPAQEAALALASGQQGGGGHGLQAGMTPSRRVVSVNGLSGDALTCELLQQARESTRHVELQVSIDAVLVQMDALQARSDGDAWGGGIGQAVVGAGDDGDSSARRSRSWSLTGRRSGGGDGGGDDGRCESTTPTAASSSAFSPQYTVSRRRSGSDEPLPRSAACNTQRRGSGSQDITAGAAAAVSVALETAPAEAAEGLGGTEGRTPGKRRPSTSSSCMSSSSAFTALSATNGASAQCMWRDCEDAEGVLWKIGTRLKQWQQRWYRIHNGFMYYFNNQRDPEPRGVLFLGGSFLHPVKDERGELAAKGYWGFEISNAHEEWESRRLYARSEAERDAWLVRARAASALVPFADAFVRGEELGTGRFSTVYACTRRADGAKFAVKVILKKQLNAAEKELLRTEIAVLRLVRHPHILRLEAFFEDRESIAIVTPLMRGGELYARIVGRPRFSEAEARVVITPIVESVFYLHQLGIVHRDIKPENILCGDEPGDITIADFGLSKLVAPREQLRAACGTLSYVAPEVLEQRGYGKLADLWSVGVILFLLLRGQLPFDGSTKEDIIQQTMVAALPLGDDVWRATSAEARDLVQLLLKKDPGERISAQQVLEHPWITGAPVPAPAHAQDPAFQCSMKSEK